MKKVISQILLIILIISIGMASVFITQANAASVAGVIVSSATEGGNFTVSLNLPDNAYGANCNVEVTYSDGSKASKGINGETGIAYIKGMESMGFTNSITFSAKVAGETKIKVTSIVIVDEKNSYLENNGNVEKTITIKSKTPAEPTTPTEPSTPTTPTETTTPTTPENTVKPNENQSSADGNNSSSNTTTDNKNTNTITNNNKVEEPKVQNPTFKDVKETVYAINGCNVRSSCSTKISSNKIGGLVKGQSVTRTGIEDTWSRIEFNGKTAYVATRLLTTEKPVEEEPEKSENTTLDNTNAITNEIDNTIAENNEVNNEQLLNQIEQEIGVLPEVGHNIATMIFVTISIISLAIIMNLQYKSKE